jgi:hypothetical protein
MLELSRDREGRRRKWSDAYVLLHAWAGSGPAARHTLIGTRDFRITSTMH